MVSAYNSPSSTEKSAEVLSPENDAGEESLEKIKAERAEVKKLMETITGLGKVRDMAGVWPWQGCGHVEHVVTKL